MMMMCMHVDDGALVRGEAELCIGAHVWEWRIVWALCGS